MPAFKDEFTFFWNYAATAFERDPYTWSGLYDAKDPNLDESNTAIVIGGMYMAAFAQFGPTDSDPADYAQGLRPISARIVMYRRCDYNQSPGYAGSVYPLVEPVDPSIAWWANLSGKLASYSVGQTAAPSSSSWSEYQYTNLTLQDDAGVKMLENGIVIRASIGSTVYVNKRTYYRLLDMKLIMEMESVPITVTDLAPGNGGYISPTTGGRLTWKISYDPTNVYGEVKQDSAKVQIRYNAEGPATEYNVSGNDTSFQVTPEIATGNFQWRVQASTKWHEESPWSDWVQISTVDSTSTPEALAPVNQIVEGATNVTFVWRHVISTGTAQTGWEIEYSSDQNIWVDLASGEDAAQSAVIDISPLPARNVYWRVRTKNADGVFGDWSENALLVIRDAPPTPVVSVTGNTRPLISWTSSGQQGYEVRVDDASSGVRYGAQTTYQWEEILSDGAHSVGVRVVNQFGLYSPWGTVSHTVLNVPLDPGPSLQAVAERNGLDVDLLWSGLVETFAEIWRDGERIDTTTAPGQYVDHTATGRHVYKIRIIDAAGNYSDSPTAIVDLPIRDAAIAVEGDWRWVRLADGSGGSLPTVTASYAPLYALNHYSGRVYPVPEVSIQRTATYSVTYELERAADIAAIRAMVGQIVVHKQKNQLLRGFLEAVQETRTWWGSEMSLQIAEVSE